MNDVFEKISEMQRQQVEVAGPMFAELSTEETWRELLRWLVQDRSGDFATQMTEVAAVAAWALESRLAETAPAHAGAAENDDEGAVWEDETPLASTSARFLWEEHDRF